MTIAYYDGWARLRKEALGALTREEAQQRHNSRQLYTVLVGVPNAPKLFIEVRGDYVGIGFLDRKLREYLSYAFQERRKGKLFLTMATYREFDEGEHVIRGTTYYFKENGTVDIEKQDFIKGGPISIAKGKINVQSNWGDYPEFGEYAKLWEVRASGDITLSGE